MKFYIRDILWLTILVAAAVTWWLDHRASASRMQKLETQVQEERLARELESRRKSAYAAARALAEQKIQEVDAHIQELLRYRDQIRSLKAFIDRDVIKDGNRQWYYLH